MPGDAAGSRSGRNCTQQLHFYVTRVRQHYHVTAAMRHTRSCRSASSRQVTLLPITAGHTRGVICWDHHAAYVWLVGST